MATDFSVFSCVFWAQFYLMGTKVNLSEIDILDKEIISNFLPEGLLAHFCISEVLISGDVGSKKMFFEIL